MKGISMQIACRANPAQLWGAAPPSRCPVAALGISRKPVQCPRPEYGVLDAPIYLPESSMLRGTKK